MEHRYQQLVLFPHLVVETEEEHEVHQRAEPYEVVTQQQLARVVALLLLVTFGVFLLGYVLGTSEQHDGLLPIETFVSTEQQVSVPHEHGRVATLEEAVTLRRALKDGEIITRTSRSVTGEEKIWYQVIQLQKGYEDDR